MSKAYERILEMGAREEELIAAGDTQALEVALRERVTAVTLFLASPLAHNDPAFPEKLQNLLDMNVRLRSEAGALHESVKGDLVRLRGESRRIDGYRDAALPRSTRRIFSSKG